MLMNIEKYYENKIIEDIIELLRWSPGIISPLSNIMEIIKMYKTRKSEGVDSLTYLLFFLGNIGGFLFNRKYKSIKTWLAYILPSILEIYILILKFKYENNEKQKLAFSIPLSSILGITLFGIFFFKNNKKFKLMINYISDYGGFLPGLLYPIASILQLVKIIKSDNVKGLSEYTWILLFICNVGLYFLSGRYYNWKSILGFLGSAILNIVVVFYIVHLREKEKNKTN